MLPREKALVKRLDGEPFALIGIDTDRDLTAFRAQLDRQGIGWRNVWEGAVPAGAGPVSRTFRVRVFPTVFVLDPRGVIRSVGHGEGLERVVDDLLAEAKATPAKR